MNFRGMTLAEWMGIKNLSDRDVAQNVGCTKQTVCRWRHRKLTPSTPYMRRIIEITEGMVPAEALLRLTRPDVPERKARP